MSEAKKILRNIILEYFEEHGQLKFCWPFHTRWRRKDGTTFSHVFRSRTRTFLHPGDFLELWESDHIDIQKQFDEFLNNGYFYSFQNIYLSSSPLDLKTYWKLLNRWMLKFTNISQSAMDLIYPHHQNMHGKELSSTFITQRILFVFFIRA